MPFKPIIPRMLVQFSTANFLSFKKRTSLRLIASSDTERRESNVFDTPITELSLLKSLVIYGPNASGKSNMFKALNFMRWFILNSAKDLQATEGIDVSNFMLSTSTAKEPSYFEIEIIIADTKYRYGFRADENIVHEEWLYSQKKIKEYKLFFRNRQNIEVEPKFEFAQQELTKLTRENALFLSLAAQFNSSISTEIIRKLRDYKFVSGVRDESHIDQTARMMDDPKYAKLIKGIILSAGLGFSDIDTERIKFTAEMFENSGMPKDLIERVLKEKREKFVVRTTHQVYDENNQPTDLAFLSLLDDESLGTQKFFSLVGPIIESILNGGVLIVDEFSSRMSAVLCEAIIQLYNSKENNPFNAQFLFVTHNTQFITKSSNVFRRDQMTFFKKDAFGATEVNSLYDLRIRKDASFDKEYLAEIHEFIPKLDISRQLTLFDGNSPAHSL